jgi:hypothetical protein
MAMSVVMMSLLDLIIGAPPGRSRSGDWGVDVDGVSLAEDI